LQCIEIKTLTIAASFEPSLPAGVIDEDPAHGLGGCPEKVAAAVPIVGLLVPDEPKVRLVNQGGRLEGLARPFVRQPGGGELAKFVVDEREQFGCGHSVAAGGSV
jgi:hypothetical protein